MSVSRRRFSLRLRPALAALWLFAGAPARAQAIPKSPIFGKLAAPNAAGADSDDEFETKHLFGFTEGVDVGTVGDKEAETEISTAIGKRSGGRYGAEEQELALEFVPTSRFSYEMSLHGVSQTMANVPGLDNLAQTTFSGLSIMPKWVVLTRGVDAPFGLAISAKPEWDRIDPISGVHTSDYGVQSKIHLDANLIPQKLYVASNLVFSPEIQHQSGAGASQYSVAGVTGAVAWRLTPDVGLGVEVEYYQAY